jgi:Type VI secretion system (T6SS), amidase effector protein 4
VRIDREQSAEQAGEERGPAAAAAAPAVGNRATAALLARGLPRGVIHPRAAAVLARRRVLARTPTRDEMIAGLEKALADAPTTTGGWTEVAYWLNGFDKADIARMTAKMTVDQLRSLRAAIERDLAAKGWPVQHMLDPIDAAALSKGAALRPQSNTIWAAYSRVKYGTLGKDAVWEFVGGSVGQGFEGENTCATRVSYAFNYGGIPIRGAKKGWSYHNKASTTFAGKAGDGKSYIVSAPYLEEYLTARWGKPDARLKTNAEARTFEGTLAADQVAVFTGPHHAGLIRLGYSDPYVFTSPGVMPVAAWKLP